MERRLVILANWAMELFRALLSCVSSIRNGFVRNPTGQGCCEALCHGRTSHKEEMETGLYRFDQLRKSYQDVCDDDRICLLARAAQRYEYNWPGATP